MKNTANYSYYIAFKIALCIFSLKSTKLSAIKKDGVSPDIKIDKTSELELLVLSSNRKSFLASLSRQLFPETDDIFLSKHRFYFSWLF